MDKRIVAAAALLAERLPPLLTALGARVPAPLRKWTRVVGGDVQRRVVTQVPFLADLWSTGVDKWAAWVAVAQPDASGAADVVPTKSTSAWIAQLHDGDSFAERAEAARALAEVAASDDVRAALSVALRDNSAEVACAAAEALAVVARDNEPAQRALWEAFDDRLGFYNVLVRASAVAALGRCLRETELAGVFRAIQDREAEVSIAAIEVVLARVPDQAQRYLIPVLVDDQGYYLPVVRLAAARALERSGLAGEDTLADLLQREQDPEVRFVLRRIAFPSKSAASGQN